MKKYQWYYRYWFQKKWTKLGKEVNSMDEKFLLIDDNNDSYEEFDSEEELIEFLKDEELSKKELKNIRVFEIAVEYEVTPSYELEEV